MLVLLGHHWGVVDMFESCCFVVQLMVAWYLILEQCQMLVLGLLVFEGSKQVGSRREHFPVSLVES